MRIVVASVETEFNRYRTLAEKAIEQLDDAQLNRAEEGSNSIAVIVRHISGNFRSRFTDFLTSDGEKTWRDRDSEFEAPQWTRAQLLEAWQTGWKVVLDALAGLTDSDLPRTVTIRQQEMTVAVALHRSLAHITYHVGQIVYAAKEFRGPDWKNLSIPLGKSTELNERMRAQAAQHS